MKRISAIIVAFVLLFAPTGVRAQSDDEALKIVATTTQAADVVTILAGDLIGESVIVTRLMGAGVDPHLYQPTEANIVAMNEADAVIYSGLHLEGQFDTVFEALGEQGIVTYPMSRPVKDAGFTFGGFTLSEELTNVDDPHFWFDPRNWQLAVEGVAETLAHLDPDHADIYMENAVAYIEQLDILYEWGVEAMSLVPEQQRTLVTSHDAFQYFGDAFGWNVRGLQGLSTEDEAGVADIQDIAEFVIENEIPVMFVESSVPPDAIEAVQEAVNNGGGNVGIGVRELFSDAMGEPETFGGTYIGMIGQNIITVLQSYGVDVPEWSSELDIQPPPELLTMEDVK
jgi:manganese/zinc/iron transport system substrate-binding protein